MLILPDLAASSSTSVIMTIPPTDHPGTTHARRRTQARSLTFSYESSQCAETAFAGRDDSQAVWAAFVAPADGLLSVSTCSTHPVVGFDTDLAVFQRGAGGTPWTQLACNGDAQTPNPGCQPFYSELTLNVTANERYAVAIGAYSGKLGPNVTLSVTLLSPIPTPPPNSPSPPPANDYGLRETIDSSDGSAPVYISLPGQPIELASTLQIPAGRVVVLQGSDATTRTTLRMTLDGDGAEMQSARLLNVNNGAALYLSNVVLSGGRAHDHSPEDCGGAVRVLGNAKLFAQYVRFENNRAGNGGAICVEADGHLDLIATEFSENSVTSSRGRGSDIFLGRPTMTTAALPVVNLLGVQLGSADGSDSDTSALYQETRARSSTSCPVDSSSTCMFSQTEVYKAYSKDTTCTPSSIGVSDGAGPEIVYGTTCSCSPGTGHEAGSTRSDAALAPYGTTPLGRLLGSSPTRCMSRLLPASELFFNLAHNLVSLDKSNPAVDSKFINISMPLEVLSEDRLAYFSDSLVGWIVNAHNPKSGVHDIPECRNSTAYSSEVAANTSCAIDAHGTMTVFDDGGIAGTHREGTPLRLLNPVGKMPHAGGNGVLHIMLEASAAMLRETSLHPYTQLIALQMSTSQQVFKRFERPQLFHEPDSPSSTADF